MIRNKLQPSDCQQKNSLNLRRVRVRSSFSIQNEVLRNNHQQQQQQHLKTFAAVVFNIQHHKSPFALKNKWPATCGVSGNCQKFGQVHPQKLTWNLEMMVSNRNLLFQGSIFRFHVCFGGCKFRNLQVVLTKTQGALGN